MGARAKVQPRHGCSHQVQVLKHSMLPMSARARMCVCVCVFDEACVYILRPSP